MLQQRIPLLHNTLMHTHVSELGFLAQNLSFCTFCFDVIGAEPPAKPPPALSQTLPTQQWGQIPRTMYNINDHNVVVLGNVNVKYVLTKSVQKLLAPLIWCVSIATDAENKLGRDTLPAIYET